ncbi:hypothetical protein JXQ31_14980 [candidate division KSB1 bacterium]|nr:hypothetical protein [candidate division KSB1 bacterium]
MVVLIVVLMFVIFIGIGLIREYSLKKKSSEAESTIENFGTELASEVFVHPSHTFAKVGSDGVVMVGMDEFARRVFGFVNPIDLPVEGKKVKQGDKAWSIVFRSKKIEQIIPVDGDVIQVNKDPLSLNDWILKIKPTHLKENIKNLLPTSFIADCFKEIKEKYVKNHSQKFAYTLAYTLQDGGDLIEGFSEYFSDSQWNEFYNKYFQHK